MVFERFFWGESQLNESFDKVLNVNCRHADFWSDRKGKRFSTKGCDVGVRGVGGEGALRSEGGKH